MLYQTPNLHGGDLYGSPVELDFSVNTNPLGTPPAVVEAVRHTARALCRYPDPYCRELVGALAEHEGVPEDSILCGSGAAELIYAYCRAVGARTALVTAPTFSEYAAALEAEGCWVLSHPLREEDRFGVTGALLWALEDTSAEVVFLCNPNNPTGRLIRGDLLEEICRLCRDRGIRLFVDECFLELSDEGRDASLAGRLEEFPNLFLLKAFTKTYGMAGLRLGYCLSGDRALLAKMSRGMQPWNVSIPAQEAGKAALGEREFLRRSLELIREERPWLAEQLEKLGFWVCPSQANYLLLKSGRELASPLLERGILIRDCSNYTGLGPGWYRVAVKTRCENQRLIAALAEIG
ncbi:MAG: aminotransferase class I/II-fold pyridoxal phosphate-dependent enzyme [Oscillospiraceae bacterium]|nr:aminotransferase class I/II-fold pyridoxal phosphate-dependent enzyme [Oscillospiraceae bacterium]